MTAAEYSFVTTWDFAAPRQRVFDLIADVEAFPEWWSHVYRKAEVVNPEVPIGHVGRKVRFVSAGRLPYSLRWSAEITRSEPPDTLELVAAGDFVGTGRWEFRDVVSPRAETHTAVRFEWHVRLTKPILVHLTPLLRPMLSWNHRWAMAQGRLAAARRLGC